MAVIRTKGNTFDFAQVVTPGAKGDTGSATNKVDKDPTTGLALMAQLPVTQTAEGNLIAQYDVDGFLAANATSTPGKAAETQWVQDKIDAITNGGGVLAKVSAKEYAPGTPLASTTDGSTFTTLPTVAEIAAASGETYDTFPALIWTGPGGLKIRRKANGSAVTNLLGFPSFESGAATGWSSSGGVTVTVDNATSRSGTYSLKATVTASGTGGQQIYSPWCPHEQGIKASTAGYIERITSTSRTCRVDAQYGDAAGNVLASVTGSNVTPLVDWTVRGIMDSAHLGGTGSQTAPTGTTQVRLRFTIISPSSGDIFRLDDAQVERADTIPAYGSTGGSGGALSCNGGWATPTPTPIAQAAGATPVVATFGTTGTQYLSGFFKLNVGGTGLTGQRIEWEFAQATANATPTTILWAAGTFARVVVAP